jgi:hypothetical protein
MAGQSTACRIPGAARLDREPDRDRAIQSEAHEEGNWLTNRHTPAAGVSAKILGSANMLELSEILAGPTRLELATSGVTGRRSNQLNYDPAKGTYADNCRLFDR